MSEMLEKFICECRKVDSRIITSESAGNIFVAIGDDEVCVSGYNMPYQAMLVTQLMSRQGSFD